MRENLRCSWLRRHTYTNAALRQVVLLAQLARLAVGAGGLLGPDHRCRDGAGGGSYRTGDRKSGDAAHGTPL